AGKPVERAGTIAQPAHGRPSESERDPDAARAAQARPQERPPLDPRPAVRAPGIPRDGEGLRYAARGPQVRAREGQQDPRQLPDRAQQDDRRPLRTAAARAYLAATPLDRPAASVNRPRVYPALSL